MTSNVAMPTGTAASRILEQLSLRKAFEAEQLSRTHVSLVTMALKKVL